MGFFFVKVIALDLKKAFNLVDHDILIQKLYDLGLSASSIKSFKSYIRKRQQFVKIKMKSKIAFLIMGVAQGSVRGNSCFSFISIN